MNIKSALVVGIPLAIVGLGVYGFLRGVPETDIVDAVVTGDLRKAKRLLDDDPALARVKVFPQGYRQFSQRRDYETRTGESAWKGRFLVHDAADRVTDPLPMLELLAASGADLGVRLGGRSLLHEAAERGNVEVAGWLLSRGADVASANDCAGACAERGWTPLHNAQRFRASEMTALLVSRGAPVDATDADGRTALHVAAAIGSLEGAFALCRFGADPARKDAKGRAPHDLARKPAPRAGEARTAPDDPDALPAWLEPRGGCEEVATLARRDGAPVPEDDARAVYGKHACARGVRESCPGK
ncbi:MAG: ankyrin repeat domain-containing protein [Burkholderiales bacterium]